MPTTYRYSAFSYFSEWIEIDRESRQVLGFSPGRMIDPEEARQQLLKVARHYSVSRNFSVERVKELPRFAPIWAELEKIEQPTTFENVEACVDQLIDALQEHYGNRPLSAVSKFLWMRFGSPIVIYDSLAWTWMCKFGGCHSNSTYGDFFVGWRRQFLCHETAVRIACAELPRVQAFLRPPAMTEDDLETLVSSDSFVERVFDHFICNQL